MSESSLAPASDQFRNEHLVLSGQVRQRSGIVGLVRQEAPGQDASTGDDDGTAPANGPSAAA